MDSSKVEIGFRVELPYMIIQLVDQDIVRFSSTRDFLLDMEKCQEMVNICKNLFPNRGYKSLKVVNHKMKVEKDVMDYLASDERKELISMEAVVVNSTTLKFLGNLYMKVKKPKIVTKVFEREKDALLWLGSYEQQQKFSTPKY